MRYRKQILKSICLSEQISHESIVPENVVENIKDESLLKKILDLKLLKHKKYLEVLEDFLNTNYEYNPCCFLSIDEITTSYNEFIKNNDNITNFNGRFGIIITDIPLINSNYIKKDIEFCKSCNKKYFKNCCNGFIPRDRKRTGCYRKRCILNISKKKNS